MARGKKRVLHAAATEEKYVPSFGNNKKRKLKATQPKVCNDQASTQDYQPETNDQTFMHDQNSQPSTLEKTSVHPSTEDQNNQLSTLQKTGVDTSLQDNSNQISAVQKDDAHPSTQDQSSTSQKADAHTSHPSEEQSTFPPSIQVPPSSSQSSLNVPLSSSQPTTLVPPSNSQPTTLVFPSNSQPSTHVPPSSSQDLGESHRSVTPGDTVMPVLPSNPPQPLPSPENSCLPANHESHEYKELAHILSQSPGASVGAEELAEKGEQTTSPAVVPRETAARSELAQPVVYSNSSMALKSAVKPDLRKSYMVESKAIMVGFSQEPRVGQLTSHEVQGIITELSLLNEYILKSKRELDNARVHHTRS